MRAIVIGAGIVGMSISYHLVEGGASVVIIDEKRPGGIASAASFACINFFNYWQPPYFELRRDAIDYARTLATRIGAEEFLHLQGTLRFAEDPAGWAAIDRSVGALKSLGLAVDYIPTEQVTRHLEPDLDLTGIERDIVRVPGEGWMDGVPYVGRLMAAVRGMGQFEWLRHKVSACEANNSGVVVVTDQRSIKGDVVILAGGMGTSQLATTLGAEVPVHPDPGVLLVSDYLPSNLRHTVYAGSVHLRPDGAGRIMAGRHGGDFPPGCSATTEARLIGRQVEKRLPSLSFVSHSVLVGIRPVPKDGFPIAGWLPGHSRAYVVACHSGMTLGPFLGKLAASEILNAPENGLVPYRPDRFRLEAPKSTVAHGSAQTFSQSA
jgi:glycine/D-amino acid oxidase-like deaminating enzyme